MSNQRHIVSFNQTQQVAVLMPSCFTITQNGRMRMMMRSCCW